MNAICRACLCPNDGSHRKTCKMCGGEFTEHWMDHLLYCRACREECGNFDMRSALDVISGDSTTLPLAPKK